MSVEDNNAIGYITGRQITHQECANKLASRSDNSFDKYNPEN